MGIRTDLAIEFTKEEKYTEKDIKKSEKKNGEVISSYIEICSEKGEKKLNREIGKYITLEFPSIDKIDCYNEIEEETVKALNFLLGEKKNNILVVGLGNDEITSDSVGPFTVKKILATRHIAGNFAEKIGLKGLRSVSAIAPNVLGKTGIEATEILKGVINQINADAVIVIDALAAGSIERLFKTIQFSNKGITPGSGVKNSRKEISEKTLGVPVIAIGVPTVVDALSLAFEITEQIPKNDTDMILTPKDADILCNKISEILSKALNVFLQPEIESEIIFSLV